MWNGACITSLWHSGQPHSVFNFNRRVKNTWAVDFWKCVQFSNADIWPISREGRDLKKNARRHPNETNLTQKRFRVKLRKQLLECVKWKVHLCLYDWVYLNLLAVHVVMCVFPRRLLLLHKDSNIWAVCYILPTFVFLDFFLPSHCTESYMC